MFYENTFNKYNSLPISMKMTKKNVKILWKMQNKH